MPVGGGSSSGYLLDLIARIEAASARLYAADAERLAAVSAFARRDAAVLSARLDGSPLTDETAQAVDAGTCSAGSAVPGTGLGPTAGSGAGGWARALRLEGTDTQAVAAVEYANLLAAFDAEAAMADDFFAYPRQTLTRLHGLICTGLVAEAVVGQPRSTAQAVHDGAQGRVIHRAPPSEAVPALLDGLVGWLGRESAGLPAVVVAGVVHERLLEWLPFEAANGRLARTASRVVLRARGLDARGLAVPERGFSADPCGYHAEVAATVRRRGDLTLWLERYAEAVLEALEQAGDAAGCDRLPPHPRALDVASRLSPGAALTLAEYAEAVGARPEAAQADLRALQRAGLVTLDPGTRGLRYRRAASVP